MCSCALGPGLAALGVNGTLSDPVISLFAGSRLVQSNTRWNTSSDAAAIRAATSQAGAFPLAEGSRDSALIATVGPGAYAVHLSGANGAAGIALVEVYDLDARIPADPIKRHADTLYADGRRIFRDDTFGSEGCLSDHALARTFRPRERRILSRRPIQRLRRGDRSLQTRALISACPERAG